MNQAKQPAGFHQLLATLTQHAMIWLPFLLGLGWIVIRPIGLHFSVMPGNYGDTRLINYILEHFYRWATGLEPGYWSARIFYPFPLALAFSDNLIGSAPFYAVFRGLGLDRELALQAWYILGFILNFLSAAFVLRQLKFHPLAVGSGAFFFTFGLPALAQIGHLQLLYRFCVPLAVYVLWHFAHQPRWWQLPVLLFLTGWQLWISIYVGVFLVMLLVVSGVLLPFFPTEEDGKRSKAAFWPKRLSLAWSQGRPAGQAALLISTALFIASTTALFAPYMEVTQLYGFTRSWPEVTTMLPRLQSYFIADHAGFWEPISKKFGGVVMRHEHQLFPGLAFFGLLITGAVWRFPTQQRRLALHSLAAAAALFTLTLLLGNISLYRAVWMIPGMDSIRSVTRIILVMMWPLAVFLAYMLDGLLRQPKRRPVVISITLLAIAGLLIEPVTFTYWQRYSTRHARERVAEVRAQLPSDLPEDPILFLADRPDESEVVSEVDAMIVSQELGWPTLNGYSGNYPPGYRPAESCVELPRRILSYMRFAGITSEDFYHEMIQRVVPVGFQDCDPAWWDSMPPSSILE